MNWKMVATVALTVFGGVATAASLKALSVPSKLAVIENRQDAFEKRMDKVDDKLDAILQRLPRR